MASKNVATMLLTLILAVKGNAADALEMLLTSCRKKYEVIMMTLLRMYMVELRGEMPKLTFEVNDTCTGQEEREM